jgi:hypothetical protein
MAAKDIYHTVVINVLTQAGWTITHDPLVLKWGAKDLFVDLGAEQLVAAERDHQKIAIEVKSFQSPSEVADLKNALGTHILYHDILEQLEPERILYLAIPDRVYSAIFEEPIGRILLDNQRVRLLVFDPHTEVIVSWIP